MIYDKFPLKNVDFLFAQQKRARPPSELATSLSGGTRAEASQLVILAPDALVVTRDQQLGRLDGVVRSHLRSGVDAAGGQEPDLPFALAIEMFTGVAQKVHTLGGFFRTTFSFATASGGIDLQEFMDRRRSRLRRLSDHCSESSRRISAAPSPVHV